MPDLSAIVEQSPYAGLFALLILGGVGFPFPEDATLILCGFLISVHTVKPVPALAVTYSAVLIADLFLYWVGKKYGRMIVTHRRFQKIVSPDRLELLEERFNRKGVLVILFGRHMVGLRAQIFIVAGIMRMPALKFLMVDAASSLLTIAIMTGAGYIGGHSLEMIKRGLSGIEHVGIFLAVLIFAFYLLYRHLARRGKGREN